MVHSKWRGHVPWRSVKQVFGTQPAIFVLIVLFVVPLCFVASLCSKLCHNRFGSSSQLIRQDHLGAHTRSKKSKSINKTTTFDSQVILIRS